MRNQVVRLALITALVCCVPSVNAGKPAGGTTASSYTALSLGVLSEDAYSHGFGVSAAGSVVGQSVHFVTVSGSSMDVPRAFYWSRGTGMLPLPTNIAADGTESTSLAWAIAGGVTGSEFAVGEESAVGKATHAVIWNSPPTTKATPLETDLSKGSWAKGVNEQGIAVGSWGLSAAIWVADSSEIDDGYKRTDFTFVSGLPNEAEDVNEAGVVVGNADPGNQSRAGIRLANGQVYPLPPVSGDAYSAALAVSNVFAMTVSGVAINAVYVAGWTQSANGVQRAVRWTVNVGTGSVAGMILLPREWASGVNSGGDVLCNYGQGTKPPTLFRNNTYYSLKPPKGATGAAAFGLAGAASSTTYAAGVAYSQRASSERAVVWTIN